MPKPAYILALVLAAVTAWAAPVASVHAQQAALVDPYFAAKLTLGLGGSATVSGKVPAFGGSYSSDRGLGVAFGVAGQYLYPLHDYFSLGGLLGIQSWRTTSDGDGGRNLVFDLAVLPQGKYALIPNQLELNFTVPFGLALNMLNEYDARSTWLRSATGGAAGGAFEGNTALGFVFGVLFGARYQLSDSLGLLAELGYIYHSVGHKLTPSASTTSGVIVAADPIAIDVSWGQFALNLGAYF